MRLFSVLGFALALALPVFAKDVVYKIDTKKSVVNWTGSKLVGKHNGTLNFKEGTLTLNEKGELKGGEFQVDMKSLTNKDLDGEMKGKLEGHLKSEDFFSVEKNPISSLKFVSVKLKAKGVYAVEANLTIKGKTSPEPVKFDATIEVKNKILTGKAPMNFDRTVYDVRYGSGKFFENLGDKVIKDNIELTVEVVAVP